MGLSWALTSQIIGLLVSTGFTLILLFALYYFVIKKQKIGEAPRSKMMLVLESYYEGFRKLIRSLSGGQHEWSHMYLFTLFNFIFINSLMPWIGIEAAPTSIMFIFPLSLLSFIGMYVIGIGTMGLWKFIKHKYANPLEIFTQFAPLLSITVRLFGATFAGSIIGNVPWIVMNGITSGNEISIISTWTPPFQMLAMIAWRIIDTALSLIQAFVFMTLTIIFWCIDTGPSWSKAERKEIDKKNSEGIKNEYSETTAEIDMTTIEEDLEHGNSIETNLNGITHNSINGKTKKDIFMNKEVHNEQKK